MLAGRNLFPVLAALLISVNAGTACAQQAALVLTSAERAALERGEPQAFIVLFDDRPFETALRAPAGRPPRTAPQSELQATRVAHYRALRSRARASNAGEEWQAEYSHLPLATVRFSSLASLHKFRGNTVVRAIYPNRAVRPSLDTASRNLVQQPVAAQIGADGAGATVVIIDTGVDYTRGAFGYCTAAGVPASCRVAYYANIVDNSPSLDSSGHGTNVAGVVAGLGSGLRIAMINIFGASSISYDSYVLDAINWALANQSAFNIRAVNMSFGDGNNNTTPCSNPVLNPYTFAVSALRDAGIVPVAAAGNER